MLWGLLQRALGRQCGAGSARAADVGTSARGRWIQDVEARLAGCLYPPAYGNARGTGAIMVVGRQPSLCWPESSTSEPATGSLTASCRTGPSGASSGSSRSSWWWERRSSWRATCWTSARTPGRRSRSASWPRSRPRSGSIPMRSPSGSTSLPPISQWNATRTRSPSTTRCSRRRPTASRRCSARRSSSRTSATSRAPSRCTRRS